MGLKVGFAGLAAREHKFVRLNARDGHPHTLAQVVLRKGKYHLLYPDGKIGFLEMNSDFQLKLKFISFPSAVFVPSNEQVMALEGSLSPEKIMFEDGYTVSEQPPGYLPPPLIHATDQERFEKPRGPWEQAVAKYLRSDPPPVLN